MRSDDLDLEKIMNARRLEEDMALEAEQRRMHELNVNAIADEEAVLRESHRCVWP